MTRAYENKRESDEADKSLYITIVEQVAGVKVADDFFRRRAQFLYLMRLVMVTWVYRTHFCHFVENF